MQKAGITALTIVFLSATAVAAAVNFWSYGPIGIAEGAQPQQSPNSAQPGVQNSPIVVQVLPVPKTQQEAAQEEADRHDSSAANWWMVRLTVIITLIGIGQLIVFGLQARRLKQSVDEMRSSGKQQSDATQASIAEAGKAASAMRDVATAVAQSAATGLELTSRQKSYGEMQMRAYLSVVVGTGAYQDQNLRFEGRPLLVNMGHTPAHKVTYKAQAEVLPFPLPAFYPLPDPPQTLRSAAVLGPAQNFILNAVVPARFVDSEAESIKRGASGRRLCIWGTVTYEDVFGTPHYTNFCQSLYWVLSKDGTEVIMGNYADQHNDST